MALPEAELPLAPEMLLSLTSEQARELKRLDNADAHAYEVALVQLQAGRGLADSPESSVEKRSPPTKKLKAVDGRARASSAPSDAPRAPPLPSLQPGAKPGQPLPHLPKPAPTQPRAQPQRQAKHQQAKPPLPAEAPVAAFATPAAAAAAAAAAPAQPWQTGEGPRPLLPLQPVAGAAAAPLQPVAGSSAHTLATCDVDSDLWMHRLKSGGLLGPYSLTFLRANADRFRRVQDFQTWRIWSKDAGDEAVGVLLSDALGDAAGG